MKIGILDIDTKKEKLGHGKYDKFPNLACGKIYGYHKEQGHEVIYPYNGEKVDRLYVSAIFSWTKQHIQKYLDIYKHVAEEIIVGGTGWDWRSKLPVEIEKVDSKWTYEMYGIDYGIGFTVRGCHVACPFCVVAKKEGIVETRVSTISDLINPKSNHIVLLNNNSLADVGFFEDVGEIKERGLSVNWNQANDITLVTPKHAEALASVDYRNFARTSKMLHFACDQMVKRKRDPNTGEWISYDMLKTVPEKVKILKEYGIKPRHLTFYMLIGFDTTLEEDLERFHMLNDLGCNIYAMMFRDLNGKVKVDGKGKQQESHVQPFRDWVNGHAFRTVKNFNDFDRYKKALEMDKQLVLF